MYPRLTLNNLVKVSVISPPILLALLGEQRILCHIGNTAFTSYFR